MRWLTCLMLAGLLTACGDEAAPVVTPAPSDDPAVGARGEVEAMTGHVVGDDEVRAATTALRTVLGEAADGDAVARGRAPAAIRALGAAALPGLVDALASAVVVERRIAALTLLQWGGDLHQEGAPAAVVAALDAARQDPDTSVRAAAELAYRRVTGDTSALDASRAEHEAAEREAALRAGR